MYFGTQYYPEQWPEERWAADAKLMAEAGINTARMGEFAWSAYEPNPGEYQIDWMERAIHALANQGIRTLLCTCSRTPPPWVFRIHPGITNVSIHGEREHHGMRYTYCPSNKTFSNIAKDIDRRIVERFAANDAVTGWQIDNEVGGGNDCYCDTCLQEFKVYLSGKYASPQTLNERWGEHFWSFRITSFDDIPMVRDLRTNPQLALEYRRFQSHLNCTFTADRTHMIRAIDPGKLVTTNFQSAHASHTDYHMMADSIDINGCNYYPFRSPELLLDFYRGDRKELFILEQFTRLEEVDSGPGWMRSWAWTAAAHGASGINFFRWRVSRNGVEMYADGILPQSGRPARRYDELKKTGMEFARVSSLLDKTSPKGDAAIAYSYESRWAVSSTKIPGFDPLKEAVTFHEAFLNLNVPTDAMDPRKDLSTYPLVIAPRAFLLDDLTAANLIGYTRAGGTLVLTTGTGVVDEYGRCFSAPRPGPLSEAAGIIVSDLSALSDPISVKGVSTPIADWTGTCTTAADEIHPISATVIGEYASGWRAGTPAITMNRYGDGTVFYIGAVFDEESVSGLVAALCKHLGIRGIIDAHPGVRAYRRVGEDYEIYIVINRGIETAVVSLPDEMHDLLGGGTTSEITLNQTDVAVLKKG